MICRHSNMCQYPSLLNAVKCKLSHLRCVKLICGGSVKTLELIPMFGSGALFRHDIGA